MFGKTEKVTAAVTAVDISRESALFVTAELTFSSQAKQTLLILRYRVRWPSGSMSVEPDELRLQAGQTIKRPLRIDVQHGDVQELLNHPERAKVSVERTRAV